MNKRLIVVALVVGLAGCSGEQTAYELVSSSPTGARFLVTCAPRRLEVGIRLAVPARREQIVVGGLENLEVPSTLRVFDARRGSPQSTHPSEAPAVVWLAPTPPDHIEYIGLQEVVLGYRPWCRNLEVEITYDLTYLRSRTASDLIPYAREATRP